ncbi:MAG: hypothetical protein OEX18_12250 [Candidatus Krumholzibacteria bacterium]|nr:hypothetical protein [Candidatus Krumholzibacteria bacterium]MDH4338035.1 hypothetical protein [Candidatus Krumholzibacteria bacterium]MDH5269386.1 hypothetical protein [Candidatus Krumholzibacteria bacterium]
MRDDRVRFVEGRSGWQQQNDGLYLKDLGEIRGRLAAANPRRVMREAEIVVTGCLRREEHRYATAPDGTEYALIELHLSEVRSVGGEPLDSTIQIAAIASGDYWPEWRYDSTRPRVTTGRDYCVALQRVDDGFVVPWGINGMFEVRDGMLYFAGRTPTGLSLEDVRTERGGRH